MKKNNIIYLNGLIDLAQSRLGSKIVYKTDEFFAPAKRIINPWPPVFKEGVFDKHGKWMDGWETRRKRTKGFDFLILKFGKPGLIKKLEIDTHHFKGNYPDSCSIQTASISKDLSNKSIVNNSKNWKFILNKSKLSAHKKHIFKKFLIRRSKENYLRINIYPDGGISRIRAFGNFVK